jgi:hypothetical protein
LPEARSVVPAIVFFVFLLLGLINGALLLRFMRRLRNRERLRAERAERTCLANVPGSLRDQLIARSRDVRGSLAARFGPSWRARTTEEIAADPVLAKQLGSDRAARLVAFLREADRAKFAVEADPGPSEPLVDFAWLDDLLSTLRAEAGARSRINGK